uniref:Cyclin-dependent kinase inhibitor domain-containing protein n=1 Tax=Heliothis virescens TaxID=7102 RepID=A0A2A4IV24_HELVI
MPYQRKIPENSKVRRQLFPQDNTETQANKDNMTNVLQELIANDRQRSIKNWNFDTLKELPVDGEWKWSKTDEEKWIGVKAKKSNEQENERTPVQVRNRSVPPIRKRRRDVANEIDNQTVKRRLSLDFKG